MSEALEHARAAHADVQQAEEALEAARDALETRVRQAVEAGHTQAAIAEHLGIDRRRVWQLVRGRGTEAERKRRERGQ